MEGCEKNAEKVQDWFKRISKTGIVMSLSPTLPYNLVSPHNFLHIPSVVRGVTKSNG